ncbi:Dse1 cell wall protein [Candida orthopsilosis Co 90-125]|uniref:Dse1 cell wall protein n=1 Tax=Candida orthopsilosis (strain 90-125) TaxID=1136231 RepID=H8X451_CANO9|nr:Dse1 cell wall protein [Candida orthopsilosis Co 90-125]CCG26003.1 Dse1 cell wall protein [Candida orthopsilosis Co 90-125]
MTDYYEPTLLFRQNAIRRFNPSLSPISSVLSLPEESTTSQSSINSPYLDKKTNTSSSWLLNLNNEKDTQVLSKSCSLNRTNIKSNYWKIPDNNMNLTSMCVKHQSSQNPLLAISSNNSDNNLFIYEINLDSNHLIHHSTISLSNIYNMKWVNNTTTSDKNYLVTGNNKGYAHLVTMPDIGTGSIDDQEYSAEICKRFNHRKHIKDKSKVDAMLPIKQLNLFNSDREMISIYDDFLFHWDIMNVESQQRPQPISITTVKGIRNFDVLPHNNTTLGICGKFGISLFDTRDSKFSIPMSSSITRNYRQLSGNIVKWNPENDNILAVGHGDGVIRLWDIRKQDYFTSLHGHSHRSTLNQVTSIEWDQGDLFSGGQDGNIIHWDLTSDVSIDEIGHMNCGLREGLDSVKFNEKTNSVEVDVNQRQCGTVLPASNTNVVSMCSVANDSNEIKIMSIDGSSFLGVHSQVKEAIKLNINPDKLYYTEEDIQELLRYERPINSKEDLTSSDVESVIDSEMPLMIRRKPTFISIKSVESTEQERFSGSETEIESDNLDLALIQSPKFNQSAEDTVSLDDFDFTLNNNTSQSDMSDPDSPQHSPINDSMDSLSTIATDLDAMIVHEKGNGKQIVANEMVENAASSEQTDNVLFKTYSGHDLRNYKYSDIFRSLDNLNLSY